jgi:hypothetical protein
MDHVSTPEALSLSTQETSTQKSKRQACDDFYQLPTDHAPSQQIQSLNDHKASDQSSNSQLCCSVDPKPTEHGFVQEAQLSNDHDVSQAKISVRYSRKIIIIFHLNET